VTVAPVPEPARAPTAAPAPARARLGILISGRGSNMEALAQATRDGRIPADVALVVSNVPGVEGLARAQSHALTTLVLESRGRKREEHDASVSAALADAGVTLVCLAGYMRLLSTPFVQHWSGRLVNVHPSLLPAFPGLDAQRQALEHGVKVSGATVHFVDEALDAGPILAQEAVAVLPSDDVASLSARILEAEHRIYPEAVRLVASGAVRLDGRRIVATSR
jgi:phosphoribosylglycinamide formyltransferase-1